MSADYGSLHVPLISTCERMAIFSFKFGDGEECTRLLEGGPWLFDGRLIVLRRWSKSLELERDLFSSVPVGIRFPYLPLKLW